MSAHLSWITPELQRVVFLTGLFLPVRLTGDIESARRTVVEPTPRRTQLVHLVQEGKGFQAMWAAEALTLLDHHDKASTLTLLHAVRQGATGERPWLGSIRFVHALASTGPGNVPCVLAALKSASGLEHELLLIALARMGGAAKESAPYLRDRASDSSAGPRTRALLRATLACVEPDTRLTSEIVRDLRDPDARDGVLTVMAHMGRQPWVTSAVRRELFGQLDLLARNGDAGEPSSLSEMRLVILAIAIAGNGDDENASKLERLQRKLLATEDRLAITTTLAVGRLERNRMDRSLRRLLHTAKDFGDADRSSVALLLEDAYELVDADIARHLAVMLSDRDKQLAIGARKVLCYGGLSAREAFPIVLEHLRTTANLELRVRAADVLARITPPDKLPVLIAMAEGQKSAGLRQCINEIVGKIQSLRIYPDGEWQEGGDRPALCQQGPRPRPLRQRRRRHARLRPRHAHDLLRRHRHRLGRQGLRGTVFATVGQ